MMVPDDVKQARNFQHALGELVDEYLLARMGVAIMRQILLDEAGDALSARAIELAAEETPT